jgi:hypothetical protein
MTWRVLIVVSALVALAGACGGASQTVEIDVDVLGGGAWTARGGAVDHGVMCSAGGNQTIEFRDPETDAPLEVEEILARQAAWTPGEPGTLVAVIELTCADGSGTLTMHQNAADDTWRVLHGSGAYAGVAGDGAISVEYFDAAAVEEPSPDDPPDGVPIALHWTGDLRPSEVAD